MRCSPYSPWLNSGLVHLLILGVFGLLVLHENRSKMDDAIAVTLIRKAGSGVSQSPSTQISKQPQKVLQKRTDKIIRKSKSDVNKSIPSPQMSSQASSEAKGANAGGNSLTGDSLPTPAAEYLVTRMPELLDEVRIAYPAEAKKAGIEGVVVVDILVDEFGRVRETRLVKGPHEALNSAAIEAVKNFKFKSAMIQDKAVAVRIRYAYRFVLER